MNKKGFEGGVWKLIIIILLAVVLVLVIYGISTKGFGPLIEQTEGKINEVLILWHLKDDPMFKECYSENVVNLGGGPEFLKSFGIEGKDIVLNVCRNRMCNFSGGLEEYRSVDGHFEKFFPNDWMRQDSFFIGSLDSVKLSWELYHEGVDLLEREELTDIYNRAVGGRFVLYSDGGPPFDAPTRAIWSNGVWQVSVNGGNYISIQGDSEALNMFVDGANDGVDDNVFWKEEGVYGNNGETKVGKLDSMEKVDSLVGVFLDEKVRLSKLVASKEDIDKLKKYLDGERLIFPDRSWDVKVVDIDGTFPIVSFVSGNEKYGFRADAFAKKEGGFSYFNLRYFPVSLVRWDGIGWKDFGNEEYYRLQGYFFDEVYKDSLVNNFLKEKCR